MTRWATREIGEDALLSQPNQRRANCPTDEDADTLREFSAEAFAHHRAGRYADAIAYYQKILSRRPDLAETYNNLGHALLALKKPEAAILAFECAIELKRHYPEALCNWGLALAELDRFDEAEVKYRQAIAIDPDFSGAYNNLGLLMKSKGRLPEAREAIERAIHLAPRSVAYYTNLAAIRPFAAGDRYLTALEVLDRNCEALPAGDQIHLNFALAKAYETVGQPQRAFEHLHRGNALKRRQIVYDEAETLGQMDRLCELMGRDFIEARQGCGEPSSSPVFIIGMMRSGTTLIEQILASHPLVFGAGELPLFDRATGSIQAALPGMPPFPNMVQMMSGDHFRALGAFYLERIRRLAPAAATRITDKTTVNFLFAGLIHLALPNATIIHSIRDPADTCVSCFATDFTEAHAHTYDLAELGRYYRHYRALMAHWQAALPPRRIVEVHYEELIADFEGTARRIVSACGLAWDAKCLDFHRTERSIRTASAAQVRRPIYTESVGRWRKYEAFLGPLLTELQPSAA